MFAFIRKRRPVSTYASLVCETNDSILHWARTDLCIEVVRRPSLLD